MVSTVINGSPWQAQLKAEETLPAKLDLIIEKLKIRARVKDELVAIKLHVGANIGYSVIHPVFVRKIVQAVKDGGGKPFVCDVDGIRSAQQNVATPLKSWDVRSSRSAVFLGIISTSMNENSRISRSGKWPV